MKGDNGAFSSRENIRKDLKKRSVRNATAKVIVNSATVSLSLISTIVLARLLSPRDFGLLAMILTMTECARYLMEMELGTATIQKQEISRDEITSLFWINAGIGFSLMVAVAALSPLVARFYGEPRLTAICLVLSTSFLFRGLIVQHRALLERHMRFVPLGAISVSSTALSVAAAVYFAWSGYGVWALVARELAYAFLYACGSWFFSGWVPGRPLWDRDALHSLRFGANISAVSFIQYLTFNVDRILIGRFSGAMPLGLYTKAFQLAAMPVENIRMVLWEVGISPLSIIQNDRERYRKFYAKSLSVISFIYMPFVVFMAIQSEEIVLLLLGGKWTSAAPLLRIFAIGGFVMPLIASFRVVMISCGQAKKYVRWGVIYGSGMVLAFSIGINWGIAGVAMSYSVACWLLFVFGLVYCLKETPVDAGLVVRTVSFPALSSAFAGLVLLTFLSRFAIAGTFQAISVSVIIIGAAYLVLWIFVPVGRRKLQEFWAYGAELFSKA